MTVPVNAVAPDVTDDELVARARDGDHSAYAALYERYGPTARRFARSRLTNESDVDDVVSQVFASVLSALGNGRGPVESFAPYLIGSVRNECHRANRRRSREPAHDPTVDEACCAATRGQLDPYAAVDEASLLREAFESLSPKFQDVLWRTEVDGGSCREVAAHYRATQHAVAMLALRARRALASAYLARHLAAEHLEPEISPACRETRLELVSLVRRTAGRRRRRQLGQHLQSCPMCEDVRAELDRLNRHLRASPIFPAAGLASWGLTSLGMNGGLKAQLAAWWSATTPVAASGLVALSVLSPTATAGDASGDPATSQPVPDATAIYEPEVITHGVVREGGEPTATFQVPATEATTDQAPTGTPQATPATSDQDSHVRSSSDVPTPADVSADHPPSEVAETAPAGRYGDVAAAEHPAVPVVDSALEPGSTRGRIGRRGGHGGHVAEPHGAAAPEGRGVDDVPAPELGNQPTASATVGNGHGVTSGPPGRSNDIVDGPAALAPGTGGGPPAHAGGPSSELPPGLANQQPGPAGGPDADNAPTAPPPDHPHAPAAGSSAHVAPPGPPPADPPPSASTP